MDYAEEIISLSRQIEFEGSIDFDWDFRDV